MPIKTTIISFSLSAGAIDYDCIEDLVKFGMKVARENFSSIYELSLHKDYAILCATNSKSEAINRFRRYVLSHDLAGKEYLEQRLEKNVYLFLRKK